ncbi:hypothetical protein EUGRSUZ_G02912 [Eucalyptus grandis]|uniref:WAT1-related protein n=2 Tax=Eucalyptus grandis TaxID=71139 RepID=A0A059BHD6_EUCGR|nr:hypothetical protein EUGRSUZ_G02912 [Eucalyptus grandis]
MSRNGERVIRVLSRLKPYLAVVLLQFGFAGMAIVAKFSLNRGMNQHVFVVYRHAFAIAVVAPFAILFERKTRPKMTRSVFLKILLLGLLEPVIDQNLFYTGMKYTTASFTAAMSNMLPAFTFLMAWFFRLERLSIRSKHSQAKILGTLVTIGGAMIMTLGKGPVLDLPWTKSTSAHVDLDGVAQKPIEGALMITAGCFCWASFIILQAITLKSYPAELTLTTLICMTGTFQGAVFAFAMERSNFAAWSIQFDVRLLAVVYSGIICSGVGYYIQGVVMQIKGPVFLTAFNPLHMVSSQLPRNLLTFEESSAIVLLHGVIAHGSLRSVHSVFIGLSEHLSLFLACISSCGAKAKIRLQQEAVKSKRHRNPR